MVDQRTLKAALRSRRRSRLALGFAATLVAFAGVLALTGWGHHERFLERQPQIPRLRRVRATVDDKGISRHESSTQHTDGFWTTRTEDTKWVRFTCHAGGDGDRDGTGLTLSGYEREWERFEKGLDYDAFYDPVAQECFLVVDESLGQLDAGLFNYVGFAALFLTVGIATPSIGAHRARQPRSLPD